MDATGVSHIAICVSDLDRSLAFYRDILGMKVTADRIQTPPPAAFPTSTNTHGKLEGRSA